MSLRIIIATILLGFSMLGIVFLVMPEYREYISLRTVGKGLRENIANKQEYFKDLQAANEELQRYQRQLSLIDYAVPSNSQIPFTYHMFSNMADARGVRVDDVAIGGGEAGKDIAFATDSASQTRPTGVTLQIRGSYENIKDYLEFLNKVARIIHIESVNLEPDAIPDAEEPPGIYRASINLKVFSY
ncbi:MAG: type 4a pilus biogenesis protein PilO [Candidatus Wildermuthbacteria bacterium]|nr:type 4a pilus biogenesis protein PilO [Candidatus Wildermuthbacteria bacterium]